jgi:hypothetical protein
MRSILVSSVVLALLALANPGHAARQVRVYEATVSSQTDPAVQAQSAMRQVLVRATGTRDAANDPALAGILAQAQQYVLVTRPPERGSGTQVVFDAGALERDIAAAGRNIWTSERELVVIVLTGGPAAGAFESRRQVEGSIDSVANRRGQPVRVARPEALGLPASGDLPMDAALAGAQRLGGDAVLVGYGDAVAEGGPWRWVLAGPGVNESWSGTLEEGVHTTADVFARNALTFAAMPEVLVLVEIDGVPSLREYARAGEALAAAGGVRGVQLAEAAGSRAIFSVLTRGSSEALQASLAASPRLERVEPAAGGAIAFRLRP